MKLPKKQLISCKSLGHRWYSLALVFLLVAALLRPYPAKAAGSFFLSPNVATYEVGSTFTMNLVVGTGGEAINAGQASISYSTDKLEVVSVSRASSIFTLWPVEPSASGGQISFAGGLPTPGYTGNGGLVISVSFKAKAAGTATARVTSGQLLLNDGSGTNILTGYGSTTYTITEPTPTGPTPVQPTPTEPKEEEPTVERPPAPIIYSDTHPKEGSWYSNNNPEFVWDKLEGVTDFSYVFNDQADTIPDGISEGSANKMQYFETGDGTWYFHVKAKNEGGWSETKHFKVQIDVTPPLAFLIRLEGESVTKDQTPNINFEITDVTSGSDHYKLLVDGRLVTILLLSESSPYTVPTLEYGKHTIVVQAFDQAGNMMESSLGLEIVKYYPGTGFKIGSFYILYAWIVIAQFLVIIILISIFILLLLLKRKKEAEEETKKTKKSKSITPKSKK